MMGIVPWIHVVRMMGGDSSHPFCDTSGRGPCICSVYKSLPPMKIYHYNM